MAEEAIDTNAGNGSSGTQHEAVGKRPGPKSRAFARGFWLVTAGVVLFLIGLATMRRLDVHAQQDQVELRHSAREEREAKLREAIDAWAVQEAVRLHAQEHDPKAVTKSLEVLRQEAMARLGVHNAALEGPTPNFGSYWKAPKTRFHVFIDEILEKAGAGLVIAAILLIIAGVVVPVYTLCSEAAGKIVDKISELPEPRASSPVAVTTLAIASTARMATTGAVARNLAIGATLAGAAVITLGVLTLKVPVTEADVPVTSTHASGASLRLDDVNVAVHPGIFDVTPANISLTGPQNLTAQVPPLQFVFPALKEQQATLQCLTEELAAYRVMIEKQTQRDNVLAGVLDELASIKASNGQLKAELVAAERDGAIQKAALDSRNDLFAKVDKSIDGLKESEAALSIGTSLAGLQYARQLNGQNDVLLNQLLRRGLIRQNCDVYVRLQKTYANLPPCIDFGWKHAFVEMPKRWATDAWLRIHHQTPSTVDSTPVVPLVAPTVCLK